MENKPKIGYEQVNRQWEEDFSTDEFNYGDGYKIKDETFALLRFREEIRAINKILRENKIKKDNFLDVGCGNGKYSLHYANKFKQILGFDLSENSINIARREADKRSLDNITFHNSDINGFNSKQKFNVIFVGGVLMYLNDEDLKETLSKLKDSLQEQGVLILREPFFKDRTLVKSRDYHVIYRSIKWMRDRLKKEGFLIIKEGLNRGYNYGILVDFYIKYLSKLFNKKYAEKITYSFLAKPWFLFPSYFFLQKFIRCKGYFLVLKKKKTISKISH